MRTSTSREAMRAGHEICTTDRAKCCKLQTSTIPHKGSWIVIAELYSSTCCEVHSLWGSFGKLPLVYIVGWRRQWRTMYCVCSQQSGVSVENVRSSHNYIGLVS